MAKGGVVMSFVIDAIIVLIWIGLFFGSVIFIVEGFDDGNWLAIGLGVLGLVIALASAFWATSGEDSKPCVRYETMMQYNAATKTTMPVRYCAQYGEWVANQ